MKSPSEIENMDDLELALDHLSRDVEKMHVAGRSSFQEVQLAANALTRVELALNDLERREVCQGLPSRELAGRSVELRNRIRMVQHALDRNVRRDDA